MAPASTRTGSSQLAAGVGAWLLRFGLISAAPLTALALFPGGLEAYGPAKAAALLAATVACSLGCALTAPVRARRLSAAMRSVPALALLALLLLLALSTVTAADRLRALTGGYPGYLGLVAAGCCIMVAFAAAVADPEDVTVWLRALALGTLVVSAYALAQALGVDPIAYRSGLDTSRAWSTLGNASNLGVWLAAALPLAAERVLRERSRAWLAIAAAALVAGAAASALTGSRAALAAVVAGALAGAVLARRAGVLPLDRAVAARGARLAALGAAALALVLAAAAGPAAGRIASDTGAGGTAAGRLAVWRAVAPMVAERPVLGWGVGGFRGAYPGFARADAVDEYGRGQTLESPHNLELSALVTGGPLALLALAIAVLSLARSLWRLSEAGTASGARPAPAASDTTAATCAAAGASLVGLFVALQAHFLTLDTAPLLAVLVGFTVAASADHRADAGGRDATSPGAAVAPLLVRCAGVGGALLACAALASALGLVIADRHLAAGFAASAAGDVAGYQKSFAAAGKAASWEPAIDWAAGRAATDLVRAGHPDVAREGVQAFDRAATAMAEDPAVLRDRADLLLVNALYTGDTTDLALAVDAYTVLTTRAPNDPLVALGQGSALASLGHTQEAATALERATRLAPQLAPAWANLASVYDALGRAEEARAARQRADSLR